MTVSNFGSAGNGAHAPTTNGTPGNSASSIFPSWVSAPPQQEPPESEGPPPPEDDAPTPEPDQANAADIEEGAAEAAPDVVLLLVEPRLQELEAGWSATKVTQWVYTDFLGPLAEFVNLTEEALAFAIDQLRARLKALDYKARTAKQYQKQWKDIAKQKAAKKKAAKKEAAAGLYGEPFVVRPLTLPGEDAPEFLNAWDGSRKPDAPPLSDFSTEGIYDVEMSMFLSNFLVQINRETTVIDDGEPTRFFEGTLRLFGREFPFRISAADFADDGQLRTAITEAAGIRAVVDGKTARLRKAISVLNSRPGVQEPARRTVTTDFGWSADGDSFLVPSGRITAAGFTAADANTDLRVDLGHEEFARHLDLGPIPEAEELLRLKRHLVDDLLQVQDRQVTHSLLAACGVAVLSRFVPDAAPLALWLVGQTGAGKSFVAKLFMSFFGDFPVASGKFASWASTTNFLQRAGFYFRDALYLIDDYKPEVVAHQQIVRLLQNYADRSGRSRLKVDATANVTRPIRGLLVSTGEDVPEHSPSSMARSIIIPVPQQSTKDLARGERCLQDAPHYRGVTADFVRHVLAQKRTQAFARRVQLLRRRYYRGIAGQQNDMRIAGNFALLGAGFIALATYYRDVWPEWRSAIRQFVYRDLPAMRDQMLGAVRDQEPADIFWTVLGQLLEHDVISISPHGVSKGTCVGKPLYFKGDMPTSSNTDLFVLSTDLSLAAINQCLREQGRQELKISPATLLGQLRRAGRLFDDLGQPIPAEGDDSPTVQVRIAGKLKRSFITRKALLLGSPDKGKPTLALHSLEKEEAVG